MTPSIFGKSDKRGAAADSSAHVDAAHPQNDNETAEPPNFRQTVAKWRHEMAQQVRDEVANESLTRLDLTNAHPGGLAQLYAEHPTKLSSLIRDPFAGQEAQTRALSIYNQAKRMADRHGSVTIHLAIGVVSWQDAGRKRSTPALLRPIDLSLDTDGQIVLTLRPGVEVSNRLLDTLSRYGSPVETAQLLESVRTTQGFSPTPALDLLREAAQAVPGMTVRAVISAGIFVHPTSALLKELGAPQWLSLSPVVRALAGDQSAKEQLQWDIPAPNPFDRDPWQERGIGDQTPSTLDVIEAATDTHSVVVDSPKTADLVPVVASIAAEHVARGRSTLVVSGQPHFQDKLLDYLDEQGAGSIANLIRPTSRSAFEVQNSLRSALSQLVTDVDLDAIDQMRTGLRRVRASLSSYTNSLHEVFPEWGISAHDALQTLTDLTSMPVPPTTKVRLTKSTLVKLADDQGNRAQELLYEAEALGIFTPGANRQAWTGVEIGTDKEVEQILLLLQELATDLLPAIQEQIQVAANETGLSPAPTLEQWAMQLEVLAGVRASLDVFQPIVFERSAADMILATAPKQWRKERGIKLSGRRRRRLIKQAKDMLRPGRYVENLHKELMLVQDRRERWQQVCQADGWPQIPTHLDQAIDLATAAMAVIDKLEPYLEPVYGSLKDEGFANLQHLAERLLADTRGARELPRRVTVLWQLQEFGLAKLVEDLRLRQVSGELLELELELAWWSSALGFMLAAEPRLGGFDPSGLQEALDEERKLDRAQVTSLGQMVTHRVYSNRKDSVVASSQEYRKAQAAYETEASSYTYYSRMPLSWELMPLVIAAPTVVPSIVPWGTNVDVVIIVETESLPLAELIPVIARGKQVIVVGAAGKGEKGIAAQMKQVLPSVQLQLEPQRINDAVVRLLGKHKVSAAGVSIPGPHSRGRVDVLRVCGTGMPAPGVHAIESSAGEVQAIVEQIRDHAHESPDTSLAVVALTTRHFDRIAEELRQTAATDAVLESFINATGDEAFVLVDAQTEAAVRRDKVILGVGFARTPHGMMIHDFGPYSQAGGDDLLAQALRSVRKDLLIVTSLKPQQIDPDRVRSDGARLLVELLSLGEETDEEEQWPTLEMPPDNLLIDLAERLYSLGLNVVPNLGVTGGMRIPLGIGHPEVPGELLVAILTDDADYIAQKSLRIRDRLWPQMLEEQGWKVRTELSMAVFIDPNREAEAIVQMVLDAVDDYYERNPQLRPVEATQELTQEVVQEEVLQEELIPQVHPHVHLKTATEAESEEITEQLELEAEQVGEDETVMTGTIRRLAEIPPYDADAHGRPPVARGLPLAAYGDDQLDEVALWVWRSHPDFDEDQVAEAIRQTLDITRRGAQSDAVLRNVVRRVRPAQGDDGERGE